MRFLLHQNFDDGADAKADLILGATDYSHEIIVIDDGSRDDSWPRLVAQCERVACLTAFRLSRNFGHQHALLAGFSNARGRAIISMDGDLQHPPEFIPRLLAAWREGNRIVETKRIDKHVFSPFKRGSSKLFYRVFSVLTNVRMREGGSDFRLLDRRVLREIVAFDDIDLFWRGAIQWVGFQSTTIPFEVEKRFAGESKYTLRRMIKFATGAIVSFSDVPLKIGIWLGLLTGLLAFAELAYVVYAYLEGRTVPGWASAVGVMAFLFGVLFVCVGLIGIYVARIHAALQRRPRYIISERYAARDAQGREQP